MALGAAGVALSGPVLHLAEASPQGAPQGDTTLKLADDLYVLRLPGEQNVVAQITSDGVVLIDGGSAKGSDALMKAVAALPKAGPVRTLFNTHWHPEQTGSNERLGSAGATIIAHENTRLWLTQNVTWPWNGQTIKKLPKVAQPSKTFYETGKLDSVVRYGYIPDAAHTDGDMYVFFPNQNVLVVGDVATGAEAGWPAVDWWTGGWIGGLSGGTNRLLSLCDANTRIVGSRGPVFGQAELRSQAEMYSTIYERLSQMLNKGKGPSEGVAAQPAKEFEDKMGNPDEFVRRSFESLWAYLSPDA
jgi:cyclase